MGYADQNLISGESITYHGRLHSIVLIRPFFVAGLLDGAAIALIIFGVSGHRDNVLSFVIPAVVLFIVSAAILVSAIISRKAAEFVVTNRRVIVKLGIVHKHTAEMFLNKIESIGVDQTLTGRTFGFGTITVHGTGGSAEAFDKIAQPFEFRRQVQEQIGNLLGSAASASQNV